MLNVVDTHLGFMKMSPDDDFAPKILATLLKYCSTNENFFFLSFRWQHFTKWREIQTSKNF